MNSGLIAMALMRHTNVFQQLVIPECTVLCSRGWVEGWGGRKYEDFIQYRADYMIVSVAGYATEVEVKVSKSDWKADLDKKKWDGLPEWITRFIYCVPEELGIPAWVPEFAGVWHVKKRHGYYVIQVARAPKRLGKVKVPEDVQRKWQSVFYSRFWHQRWELSKRIPKVAA